MTVCPMAGGAPPDVIPTLERIARERLADWPAQWQGYHWPGYTYEHTLRVRNLALELARREGADPQVAHFAALLHDIRKDAGKDHARVGAGEARSILTGLGVKTELADRACEAIARHSGENNADSPSENLCLGDADLIDANFGLVAVWRFITIRAGHEMALPETLRSMAEWIPRKDEMLGMLWTRSGRLVGRQRAQRVWAFWEELQADFTDGNGHYTLRDVAAHVHHARGRTLLEQQVEEIEAALARGPHQPLVPVVCRALRAEIEGMQ